MNVCFAFEVIVIDIFLGSANPLDERLNLNPVILHALLLA